MLDNIKSCIDYLLTDYSAKDIFELEVDTILGKDEWDVHHEMLSGLLTIIRNPKVCEDPILFGQVTLAINGIRPSFLEYDFITPEMGALFFKTCEYLEKKLTGFKRAELDEDVITYIALCCAEDGVYFLKNELEFCQPILINLEKVVYNTEITENEIQNCEQAYKTYKDMPTEAVPETSPELIQAKRNYIIRDYLKEIFNDTIA